MLTKLIVRAGWRGTRYKQIVFLIHMHLFVGQPICELVHYAILSFFDRFVKSAFG